MRNAISTLNFAYKKESSSSTKTTTKSSSRLSLKEISLVRNLCLETTSCKIPYDLSLHYTASEIIWPWDLTKPTIRITTTAPHIGRRRTFPPTISECSRRRVVFHISSSSELLQKPPDLQLKKVQSALSSPEGSSPKLRWPVRPKGRCNMAPTMERSYSVSHGASRVVPSVGFSHPPFCSLYLAETTAEEMMSVRQTEMEIGDASYQRLPLTDGKRGLGEIRALLLSITCPSYETVVQLWRAKGHNPRDTRDRWGAVKV